MLDELINMIEQSKIMKLNDENWPAPDKIGKQELDIIVDGKDKYLKTSKIGSFLEVSQSQDPEGLSIFYYFVQDLKSFIFSLITLHFRVS